ncbi:MAG: type II secretion system protein [Puniceicoccaceae bacterium]|nr:MAG: type II secretion system protein [Puniceicoccaceae bacterium]
MKLEKQSSQRNDPGGFTLIELLVVSAVIGILASVLVPAMQGVRSSAEKANCASNMRQIGLGIRSYANEHSGRLPKIAHGIDEEESWIFTIAEYLGNVDEVRVSPADPQFENKRRHRAATTYILNDLVFLQKTDGFTGLPSGPEPSLLRLNEPSRTILAFTGAVRDDPNQVGFSATNDHTHAGRWNSWSRVTNDISPDLHRSGARANDRTNGSSNYLFADGSVSNFQAREVKNWTDSGINIANPEGFRTH